MIQLYIYIYSLFFRLFFHIGHYRVLSRVPRVYRGVLESKSKLFNFQVDVKLEISLKSATVRGFTPRKLANAANQSCLFSPESPPLGTDQHTTGSLQHAGHPFLHRITRGHISLSILFYFYFWPYHTACGILVPH